jgi:hypothetical protein
VVIVAFVLVLLAAATFAAGIAASRTSDALVYVSIIFSLAAFVTLAIASLRARQAEREVSQDDVGTQRLRSLDEAEAHVGPLLGGLDPAQLDMTPSWRRQPRRRWEVADPVDDEGALEEQLENEEDEADFEVPVEPVAARAPAGDDLAWGFDDEDAVEEQEPTAAFTPVLDDDDDLDAFETFEEDELVDLAEAEPEAEPEPEPADSSQASFFDQYDDLTAAEIVPFLSVLDRDGLQWVRARERSGAKRVTVLNKAEQLIGEQGGRAPRASTRKKTPAKKAAAARRTTKSTAKTAAKSTAKTTRRR